MSRVQNTTVNFPEHLKAGGYTVALDLEIFILSLIGIGLAATAAMTLIGYRIIRSIHNSMSTTVKKTGLELRLFISSCRL
jgi:hypothetical protein